MDWQSILFGGAVGGLAAAGIQVIGQHLENRTQRLLTAYSDWVVALQEVARLSYRYFFEGQIHAATIARLGAIREEQIAKREEHSRLLGVGGLISESSENLVREANDQIRHAEEGAIEAGRALHRLRLESEAGEGVLEGARLRAMMVEKAAAFRAETHRFTQAVKLNLPPLGQPVNLKQMENDYAKRVAPILERQVGEFVERLVEEHGFRGWPGD